MNLKNVRITEIDFYNLFNTLTREEKKSIIGYELTYHIGSDSYKYYIREISDNGKNIKISRDLNNVEYVDEIDEIDGEMKISRFYKWEHYSLRKRKNSRCGFKYLQRSIKDQLFCNPNDFKTLGVEYRGYKECGHLDFNGGVDYRDPCY